MKRIQKASANGNVQSQAGEWHKAIPHLG